MADDDPLRDTLARKIRQIAEEAAAREGEVPPDQLEALNRLARLIELRDEMFAATPSRWPIVTILAATVVVVGLLLFLRVPETEVEIQALVSETAMTLAQAQTATHTLQLAELGASGLHDIQQVDEELVGWVKSPQNQSAVRVAAEGSGTITLNPLNLPAGVELGIDAEHSPDQYRLVLRDAATILRATMQGAVRIDIPGAGQRMLNFAIPRPLLLETDPQEVTLDLRRAARSSAVFAPQLAIEKLTLSRIDEFQGPDGATPQTVSTILSGTIYLESLNGERRVLRPRELLRFDDIRGVIRTLEMRDGGLLLAFRGKVRGMRTGWGDNPVDLMPTWLEWLKARHGLSLLWGTTLYLFGLGAAIVRWWRSP